MLPARHRMRTSDEFSHTIRRGGRSGGSYVVTHVLTQSTPATPARVGFVVSKAVGNAVERNRVKRQLRALLRSRLDRFSCGSSVVIRALPRAATASFDELDGDVNRALDRATRRGSRG